MPRERTIKGPAKRGTITKRQARTAAREVLEEKYGKAGKSYADGAAKKPGRSSKQQTSRTSHKRGNRT